MTELSTLIIDGDWGGDEMQLATVLLAASDRFRILGASCIFGNAPLPQVTSNAGRILAFLGAGKTPYYAGAAAQSGEQAPEGDGAHGQDGIGGIPLPKAVRGPETQSAADFILETLRREPEGSVTITATGPLSNIAQALAREPETMRRLRCLVVMGGCTSAMPARDLPERRGNITPMAEFNFYMAPRDAQSVLNSGLPIVLFPMNCTHQLTFTPERQKALKEALAADPASAATLHGLINAPHELDASKFGIEAVLHDVHTALYLLAPQSYSGTRGRVEVSQDEATRGHSVLTPDPDGSVLVMEKIEDPEALFARLLGSFRKLFTA